MTRILQLPSLTAPATTSTASTSTAIRPPPVEVAPARVVENVVSGDAYVKVESVHGSKRISLDPTFAAAALFSFLTGQSDSPAMLTVGGSAVLIIGPEQADQIETLLATYNELVLLPGTYEPTSSIDIPDGKFLCAPWGQAEFVPNWSPVIGDADLATNYVLGVRGALGGATTTLTGNHLEGSTTLAVASTTGLLAGEFLYLTGYNSPANDALNMSDGTNMFVREVVEIQSIDSGTAITLKHPLTKHHAQGRTVARVSSRPSNVTLRGISIRAPGGTIAVGISLLYASHVTIENCAFEGLSRAGIDGHTSRDIVLDRIHSHGEVNAIALWDGCDDVTGTRITSSQTGLREHANGIPRWLWSCTNGRCVRVTISDSKLMHANGGIRWWSGMHLECNNVIVSDMVSTAAIARDPILAGGYAGNGLEGAPAPLNDTCFTKGCKITNLTVIDCHSPAYRDVAQPVYPVNIHDMLDFQASNIQILNKGSSTSTRMHGIHFQDSIGTMTGLVVVGCWDAISVRGNYEDIDLYGVYVNGRPSTTTPYLPNFALYIDSSGSSVLRLHGAKMVNYNTYWAFGSNAISSPPVIDWTDIQIGDTARASRVILARRHSTLRRIAYDGEAGGPFTVGETISWSGGTGVVLVVQDLGATGFLHFTLSSGVNVTDNQVITGGSSGATASANGGVEAATAFIPGDIAELEPTLSTTTMRYAVTPIGQGAVVGMVVGYEAYLSEFFLFAPFPQHCRGATVTGTTPIGSELEVSGRALAVRTSGTAVARALSETAGAGNLMIGGRQ